MALSLSTASLANSGVPVAQNNRTEAPAKAEKPTEAQLKKRQDAERAAQEFETLFVDMMVKSMRKSAQAEDVSNAEDIYQGMLDSEYSKSMTTSNNFGIRDKILDWMEQTDPSLKTGKRDAEQLNADNKKTESTPSADSLRIQNEMWALKAASQAYQLSGRPR